MFAPRDPFTLTAAGSPLLMDADMSVNPPRAVVSPPLPHQGGLFRGENPTPECRSVDREMSKRQKPGLRLFLGRRGTFLTHRRSSGGVVASSLRAFATHAQPPMPASRGRRGPPCGPSVLLDAQGLGLLRSRHLLQFNFNS